MNEDMNKIIIDKKKLKNDILNKYKNLKLLNKDNSFFFTDKIFGKFFLY